VKLVGIQRRDDRRLGDRRDQRAADRFACQMQGILAKFKQPLTADDIAESVYWAATLPPHVNVNTIELMPTAQSFAAFQIARDNDRD
jgi:hypothetical protein